jgi:hypothetical protein
MVAATVGGGLVAVVRELFTKKSKDKQDSSLEHVLITSLQQDDHAEQVPRKQNRGVAQIDSRET